MELKVYKVIFEIEDSYWWYIGLRELIYSFVNSINTKKERLKILDAGCGTGKILENFNAFRAYGLDFAEEALRFCNLRRLNNLMRASICDLPLKTNSFDIVTSLDVMCCIDAEHDKKILDELYRVINNNGVLLLNLPAYNFLQSSHDKAVHIKHRYVMNELKKKVEKAGFAVEMITYRNTFLFPIAAIKRIIDKIYPINTEKIESDLKPLPYMANKIFTGLLLIENKLIRSGVSFPFGLSIYCVARKN